MSNWCQDKLVLFFFFSLKMILVFSSSDKFVLYFIIFLFNSKTLWAWNASFKKKHRENCKKLPWEHFICCWGVKLFLPKYVTITTTVTTVNITTLTIWVFEFCHNLKFWVLSQFEFWVLSQFEFEFCPNLNFEFCHTLSFWFVSQFEFLSCVTIWVSKVCHIWVF